VTPLHFGKLSHANADAASREHKARRIESVLRRHVGEMSTAHMLDIGTGSGFIASYFARTCASLLSVDVVDERMTWDFPFVLVQSELLPTTSDSYDVVISNHVVEHVEDQLLHLAEICRVLRPDGICYLATPNRYAVVEPHYRLPLLSWLPASARDRYVRLAGRGQRFDITPLTLARLRKLSAAAGLEITDVSVEVAREAIRSPATLSPALARVLRFMQPGFPSFVVLLSRRS
jgi:SAM-dependent methyltransferase